MLNDIKIDTICEQLITGVTLQTALQANNVTLEEWSNLSRQAEYGMEPDLYWYQQIRQAEGQAQAQIEQNLFNTAKGQKITLQHKTIHETGDGDIEKIISKTEQKYVRSDKAAEMLDERKTRTNPVKQKETTSIQSIVSAFLKDKGIDDTVEETKKMLADKIPDAQIIDTETLEETTI